MTEPEDYPTGGDPVADAVPDPAPGGDWQLMSAAYLMNLFTAFEQRLERLERITLLACPATLGTLGCALPTGHDGPHVVDRP